MSGATQMTFPFDMTPCGPVAEAMARGVVLAGIREKVDHDLDCYGEDVDGPDFGED